MQSRNQKTLHFFASLAFSSENNVQLLKPRTLFFSEVRYDDYDDEIS